MPTKRRRYPAPCRRVWVGKTSRVPQGHSAGDASGMLEVVWLTLVAVRAACRQRCELVTENLLLRHQLALLTRPTRRRPRVRFRRLDQLLWVLTRRLRPEWRRHLVVVTPDTVVRWHR